MLNKITNTLDFHGNALILRAERQRTLASNIANADTPSYVARDFHFPTVLRELTENGSGFSLNGPATTAKAAATHETHLPVLSMRSSASREAAGLGYSTQSQPHADGNSVDLDRERANFVDNSVHYEATLRFINGQSKTMLSAIQGQ